MTFSQFMEHFRQHFKWMTDNCDALFDTATNPDTLWDVYLNSFPEGTNPFFRKRREYDCSCCRHFIRRFGSVVGIVDNRLVSIWDFQTGDSTFDPVVTALAHYVKSFPISDLHTETFVSVGTAQNFEHDDHGKVREWNHFQVTLPKSMLIPGITTEERAKANVRDNRQVFKRSMDEISMEAIDTVLELIESNSLYRGEEWKSNLITLREYKQCYLALSDAEKDPWAWRTAAHLPIAIARIRNHSIGTLLIDLSSQIDLDTAVRKYEAIVAPANYKRPKALFSKRMVEEAQKTITELGYLDSLPRRHAKLDDITVNNILFANRDATKRMHASTDVFGSLATEAQTKKPMDFTRAEEISIQHFVEHVLPSAREVEAYVENRHASSLVSLIAPQNPDAPSMFKWNNGFGWAYNGNIADSDIRENVKNAGGQVNGVLRFSIQWNDGKDHNTCDYDAHCKTPSNEIYYAHRFDNHGGTLDVDIQVPDRYIPAVENIVWETKRTMLPGKYEFFVHNFCARSHDEGFRAELEVDGTIYSFDYPNSLGHGRRVSVATVTLKTDGTFEVKTNIPVGQQSGRDIWGIKTNQFVPVSTIMYSPNYWDDQQGIGHRHYFFMLDGCVNPDSPNGFYNEFLKQELLEHKRVFEALGSRMKVEQTNDQLSGLGFSATKRNHLVVRVTGAIKRVFKIMF